MQKKSVGGYEYEQREFGKSELLLRFKISTERQAKGVTPLGLAYAIESAFRMQSEEPKRAEAAKIEREGAGVDPIILRKMRVEIDKLLSKFDNRTVRAAEKLAESLREFSKGDRVKMADGLTGKGESLSGREGVVIAIRKKYVLVKLGKDNWRVSPSMISKIKEGAPC